MKSEGKFASLAARAAHGFDRRSHETVEDWISCQKDDDIIFHLWPLERRERSAFGPRQPVEREIHAREHEPQGENENMKAAR